MKDTILAAADIIRRLDRAGLHFEVTTLEAAVHPLLAPSPGCRTQTTIRIHLPDHEANYFQPRTAVTVTLAAGETVPTVRAANLHAGSSARSDAARHTLTMFQARLRKHRAAFAMTVIDDRGVDL